MHTKKKPHLEKLKAVLENPKLPGKDKDKIDEAIKKYCEWLKELELAKKLTNPQKILQRMVELLNEYKLFIELDLIFDSESDFLYRQKGQLKIDNSIIEEFLPHLIIPELLPGIEKLNIEAGPVSTFSSVYFTSTLENIMPGGGFRVKLKDQDFAISRQIYLQSSHDPGFGDKITESTNIAYVAVECKTNLDKTMFQEAAATAHDVKAVVPGAKYYLLCEWLDMTPVSTAHTDIDEAIILRKAKRLNANIRKEYNVVPGRRSNRDSYKKFLLQYPIHVDMASRLLNHINKLFNQEPLEEKSVLKTGYF
jgi:hypothetical protein